MNKKRLILLLALALLVGLFFFSGAHRYLTFDALKSRHAALQAWQQANPWLAGGGYFAVYILITALSLPGAAIMTLAGGAVFGFWQGLLLVSFASSIGATLAFLVSRYVLRDSVRGRFGKRLDVIDQGLEKDGAFYLFSLRLIPVFPFFLINLLMGLTAMKTVVFYSVSQLGMLPGTAVFVNAGTQLAALDSPAGILSPALLISLALLGIFPLLARKALAFREQRKVYSGYSKPASFDRNLIVIGAGSGGLVAAYIAAAVKAKVTLIEKHAMGGDCLNTGCVPSKALIRSAAAAHAVRESARFGIHSGEPQTDFAAVMARVHEVISKIEPHDSVERYTALGVECVQGEAKLLDPWTVEVNGQRLSARDIIIATGARPAVPPISGLQDGDYLTSDTLWSLREQPQQLLILGGGPIGCELAQAFARLGVKVTLLEAAPRLLIREDEIVSETILQALRNDGVAVHTGCKANRFEHTDAGPVLYAESDGEERPFAHDKLLIAVGRKANVSGFGLQELGVRLRDNGTVDTDAFLATNFPNIRAVGDVTGPYQFTHVASHQAWYASVNALFGQFKRFRADYRVIPMATFTSPQVARVGLNESEAQERGIAYELTSYDISDLDRAIADGNDHGFIRVLTEPGKDRILGATLVGAQAAELNQSFVIAMRHGLGLNKLLGTIHPYPTMTEANKYLAGQWKQAHKPDGLLAFAEKYHAWRRKA
ncbi:FAD-dependent oxidoreductase [Granulosicoccaceae sp. 1_MG-2023]|nr:FAD-dependent oxidoreductase [Granulosicoccaceae sp. 1_MG-2023]